MAGHVPLFPLSRVNAGGSLVACFFVCTKAISLSDQVPAVLIIQVVLLNSIPTRQWLHRVYFIHERVHIHRRHSREYLALSILTFLYLQSLRLLKRFIWGRWIIWIVAFRWLRDLIKLELLSGHTWEWHAMLHKVRIIWNLRYLRYLGLKMVLVVLSLRLISNSNDPDFPLNVEPDSCVVANFELR
jgi:hypothetical protein